MKRGRRRFFIGLAIVALAGAAANARVSTRQGVNFRVTTKEIPLAVKVLSFFDRHCQYQLLARDITGGLTTDQERALALYRWTSDHIRPTPPEWPVIDDHIHSIIIRGYGEADQMADVFTTLAVYANLPAFWQVVKYDTGSAAVIFSLVLVDGRWALFDVTNHLVFRDAHGRLEDVRDLLAHPERVEAVAGTLAPGGLPYGRFVEQLQPFRVPVMLRARQQMPMPRVVYEIRRALGLIHETPVALRVAATAQGTHAP